MNRAIFLSKIAFLNFKNKNMNKTIKTFLILSFITATCWAYFLGGYMGTRLSAGYHSVSSITGGGGWSPGHAPTSSSSSGSHAFGNLFGNSGGSSGNITAQSNSGTSGTAGTGTPTINITKDGIILEYENGVKTKVEQNAGEGFVEAVTRTIGNNSEVINKVVAGVITQNQGKFSALSVEAVAELESEWLVDYMDWIKEIDIEDPKYSDKMKIVNDKIYEIAEKYGIPIPEARALLMAVDGIIAEQPGVSDSLIVRLNELSIKDPLFTGVKENVLLQKAIAEAVPETSGSGEVMRPMPIMGPFERGDFEANESRAGTYQVRDSNGNLRFLTPAEAREVAIITYERSKQGGDPLSVGVACPTLGGDFASIIQEVTGESPMDPYGSAAYEADISRFSNYYQVSEGQAKQAINLLLGDSIIGNEWVQRDPETGEVKVDYLEVGPETGVGYPICPIMSNDIVSYLNYTTGAGPRPEAPTSKDIERIKLDSRATEVDIQNKAEELNNEVGTNISEEMMIMALGLAIVDKGLIITDENVREVISSITLNEVEYYISMINKVAGKYSLTPSEAVSVLKMHIADQRASNPNYKLSQENDIIGSIEANKNTSRLLEIVQEAKAGNIPAVDVDLNHDGEINLIDSAILMSFWGENSSGQNSDINKDGNTNLTDFSIMMSYWNYTFK